MDDETRSRALGRLKRIAGQLSGIQRMLEQDRACADVLLQIAAAQAALLETGRVILAGHVEASLADAARNRDAAERRRKLGELTGLLSRFLRMEP